MTMTINQSDSGKGERALRWIGDLDHPFYSDERNRHVWYEASAIAFQLFFMGTYYVGGIVLWVLGGSALVPVLVMFLPAFLAVIVFQTHLQRNSAEYWPGKNDFVRRRGQVGIFSGVVFLSGLLRAVFDLQGRSGSSESNADSFAGGMFEGMLAGVLVGIPVIIAISLYKSRKKAADDQDDAF